MRIVALQQGLVGKTLAMPVHGDGGRLMLAKGMRLTPVLISSLLRHGYTRVAIDDRLLDDVLPDPFIREETRREAIRALDQTFRKVVAGSLANLRPVKDAVNLITADLQKEKGASIGLYSLSSYDEQTYTHSLNVCVLSIAVGQKLKLSAGALRQLGIGALLHDAGKMLIPHTILNKPSKLTEDEYALVKTHTTKGWEILSECYEVGPIAAHAALDHHEREDGSGYPRQRSGKGISVVGKITAVADVYEAMTSDRPQRKAILPEIVHSYLSGAKGSLFASEAVDALLSTVALYPAGTILSFWGGYVGVVTKQDRRSTSRPRVRIMRGPEICEPVDVSLFDRPGLVVDAVLDDYPTGRGNYGTPSQWPETPPSAFATSENVLTAKSKSALS